MPEDWDSPKYLCRGRCLRSGKLLKAKQKKKKKEARHVEMSLSRNLSKQGEGDHARRG